MDGGMGGAHWILLAIGILAVVLLAILTNKVARK
jgi:hypothetical protein